jgi:hypothetical protein
MRYSVAGGKGVNVSVHITKPDLSHDKYYESTVCFEAPKDFNVGIYAEALLQLTEKALRGEDLGVRFTKESICHENIKKLPKYRG